MRTLNLGILAHVDAGKTSLTERLLYAAGVIDRIGSVDDGNTQTDTLALERQRGITIKAAVVSFVVDGLTVNLIDTPGHPDFIAEVERVLNVLDGAVLVVSAVEGVQAQTRILMRTLQRLKIPTLIFVNKIDRGGAQPDRVFEAISERLTPAIVAMGSAHEPGTRSAGFVPFGVDDFAFRTGLAELLADHDDAMLAGYLDDATALSYRQLREALAAQSRQMLVHPVFFGSAITGAGVDCLIAGIKELLPATEGDPDGPVSGSVFKVERGRAGEKIAYVRLFSGTVRMRDRVMFGRDRQAKVTAISVFDRGPAVPRSAMTAGQIGKLWGLGDIQIGDAIGLPQTALEDHHFAPPTLETVVAPTSGASKGALHAALAQLAEQDPLIDLRQDDVRQEISVSLYGEVQKEVIQQTLASEFGIDVEFRETTTICIERPAGTGAAAEIMGEPSNPFQATIGLRIDPAPVNSGIEFRLEVELGSIPLPFHKAVEETTLQTLRQGLCGWQVTDCTITMTHSGYSSPSSVAADFRNFTPLVVMDALKQAGTVVCEPIHRLHLDIPPDTLAAVLPLLARLGAVPQISDMRGPSTLLEGDIPAARLHQLQQQLPALTRGEAVLEYAFDHYRPMRGTPPTRPRSDYNPLNRKEYMLHLMRRRSNEVLTHDR
jgi:ribosomal protection tetracycline resistance protein